MGRDPRPTLTEAFERQAGESAEAAFLLHGDEVVSWREAAGTVARTAAHLAAAGVAAGDRVALACGNSPSFVYLWLALSRLGATSVPLHGQSPAGGIAGVIEDAGAGHAVGDAQGIGRIRES